MGAVLARCMRDGQGANARRHQRGAGCYAGESTLDGLLNCAVDVAQGVANRSNATGEALTVCRNSGCCFFVRREKARGGPIGSQPAFYLITDTPQLRPIFIEKLRPFEVWCVALLS